MNQLAGKTSILESVTKGIIENLEGIAVLRGITDAPRESSPWHKIYESDVSTD